MDVLRDRPEGDIRADGLEKSNTYAFLKIVHEEYYRNFL